MEPSNLQMLLLVVSSFGSPLRQVSSFLGQTDDRRANIVLEGAANNGPWLHDSDNDYGVFTGIWYV